MLLGGRRMTDANLNPIQILLLIIIPSLIAGFPAILSAIIAWKDRRKRLAESLNEEGSAAEKVSLAWEKLAEDLQQRIDKLEARLNKSDEEQKNLNNRLNRQRKRINYLEDGVQILIKQLKALGVEPNFTLEDEDKQGE